MEENQDFEQCKKCGQIISKTDSYCKFCGATQKRISSCETPTTQIFSNIKVQSRSKIAFILITCFLLVGIVAAIILHFSNTSNIELKNEFIATLSPQGQKITIQCLSAMKKSYTGNAKGLLFGNNETKQVIDEFKQYYENTNSTERSILNVLYDAIGSIQWTEANEVIAYDDMANKLPNSKIIMPDETREKVNSVISLLIEYYCTSR